MNSRLAPGNGSCSRHEREATDGDGPQGGIVVATAGGVVVHLVREDERDDQEEQPDQTDYQELRTTGHAELEGKHGVDCE
jgi:hypothetical protein